MHPQRVQHSTQLSLASAVLYACANLLDIDPLRTRVLRSRAHARHKDASETQGHQCEEDRSPAQSASGCGCSKKELPTDARGARDLQPALGRQHSIKPGGKGSGGHGHQGRHCNGSGEAATGPGAQAAQAHDMGHGAACDRGHRYRRRDQSSHRRPGSILPVVTQRCGRPGSLCHCHRPTPDGGGAETARVRHLGNGRAGRSCDRHRGGGPICRCGSRQVPRAPPARGRRAGGHRCRGGQTEAQDRAPASITAHVG